MNALAVRSVVVAGVALVAAKVVCWTVLSAAGAAWPHGWELVFALRDEAALVAVLCGSLWLATRSRIAAVQAPVAALAHACSFASGLLAATCVARGALIRWDLLSFLEWRVLRASVLAVVLSPVGGGLALAIALYVLLACKLPVAWLQRSRAWNIVAATCAVYALLGTIAPKASSARELTWAPLVSFLRRPPLTNAWTATGFVSAKCPIDVDGEASSRYARTLEAAKGRAPLSVVVFFWESVRVGNLSLYGYGRPTTPYLDSLASRSLVFDAFYAHDPRTIKSLTSFMLGMYPETTWEALSWHHADAPGPDLASRFRDAGWATLLVYNSSLKFDNQGAFLQHRGFDAVVAPPEESPLADDRAMLPALDRFLEQRAKGDKPFFAVLWGTRSHHPYELPSDELRPFAENTSIDRYDNTIAANDRLTRGIVQLLAGRGLEERTVVVVVGDHGEAFGEHHNDRGGHGNYLYEESVHVPLVFVHPTLFRDLPRDARPFQMKDLGASLCELTGLPRELGHSRSVFRDYVGYPVFFNNRFGKHIVGVRDGDWKLVVDLSDEVQVTRALYSLSADPGETVNRTQQELARTMHLEMLLRGWYQWNEKTAAARMGATEPAAK